MTQPIEPEVLAVLCRPFFDQGEQVVYASECCGRVSVMVQEPRRCGTCQGKPEVTTVRRPEA